MLRSPGDRGYGGGIGLGIVISVFGILLALIAGMVLGTGSLFLIILLSAVLALPVLFFHPHLLFWAVLFAGLVLSGLIIMYLPGLRMVRWVVPVASLVLLATLLFYRMFGGGAHERHVPKYNLLFWSVVLFIATGMLSALANWQGYSTMLFGVKNYYQVVPIFFAMALMPWADGLTKRFVLFLLVVACIQLPFALHQYLFWVPLREHMGHGIVPQDIVAGTFGGNLQGGGANAALSAFLFVALALILAMWKNRVLNGTKLALLLPFVLVPVFLNESKISVVYMLLIFAVVFFRQLTAHKGKLVIGMVLAMIGVYALLYVYAALHPSPLTSTPLDLVKWTITSNTSELVGYGSLQLNRWTSFVFWIDQHGLDKLAQTLVGHGLSASKEASGVLDLATTLAMTRYPGMGIGLTSVSSLLWDVGLLGLGATILMFIVAFRTLGRLLHHETSSVFNRSVYEGLRAALLVLFLSLAHKNSFVFDLPYQTVIWLLFGYIMYASRSLPERASALKYQYPLYQPGRTLATPKQSRLAPTAKNGFA